ncbi:MAG: PorT family protein [Prevotella sp.]|nr:PorT family protein [Prevotella sp.]
MRKVFFTMMLLAATTLAWAQGADKSNKSNKSDHPVTLIPKVGVNYSTTSLSSWVGKGAIDKPDVYGLIGPVGGLELEYGLKEKLSLSAAVLYSMQGRKYDDLASYRAAMNAGNVSNMIDATISTQRHHYINVPVTANYYVAKGLALRLGAQVGCLFYKSGRQEWPYDDTFAENPKHSLGSSPMVFDLSIPIGVSYILKEKWQFDLRYNHGLTKISSSSGLIEEKNRVVQFTVGYRLNLTK